MTLIIVLLLVWLVTTIIGLAFSSLSWLALIGIVLFVGTATIGYLRRETLRH